MEEVFAQHRQVRTPEPVNAQDNDASVRQKATIVLQMIRTNFGMQELSCRCMSLNSAANDRCKSQAKTGNLFCSKHQISGAIASALLKVMFEMEPDLIRPLVTNVPGGIFESKVTRDAATRNNDEVARLTKKIEKNTCRKADGSQCTTPTRNADGYCHNHRSQKPKPVEPTAAAATPLPQQPQQSQSDGEDSDFEEPRRTQQQSQQLKRRATRRRQ